MFYYPKSLFLYRDFCFAIERKRKLLRRNEHIVEIPYFPFLPCFIRFRLDRVFVGNGEGENEPINYQIFFFTLDYPIALYKNYYSIVVYGRCLEDTKRKIKVYVFFFKFSFTGLKKASRFKKKNCF